MQRSAWPNVTDDLASTRRKVAKFLDDLDNIYGAVGRQNCVVSWADIADAHFLRGDQNTAEGALDEASENWLCALTAFEVVRRLADERDPRSSEVLAKVEAGIQKIGRSRGLRGECVRIACCHESDFLASYWSTGESDLGRPAVICITSEGETRETLLARLLPVMIDRTMSVLVVSHNDVSNDRCGHSEVLSNCLDYLATRRDLDAARIGVYGDGISAALATDFALSDRRVAAAVCDGGLWDWTRTQASIGWLTRTVDLPDQDVLSARRSQLARQLRCPVLVIAGAGSSVCEAEAVKLQADCVGAPIDLELTIPRMASTPLGEIENFVISDECVFTWLEHKLASRAAR